MAAANILTQSGAEGRKSGAGGRKFRIAFIPHREKNSARQEYRAHNNKCPTQYVLPHRNTVGKIVKPAQRAGGPTG